MVRDFAPFAHPQADQAKRQQTAQFGATGGGRHLVGWKGVGALHCLFARGLECPYRRKASLEAAMGQMI